MSAAVESCASCGTAGGDDIKLKRCNGCYLVKYCSVKCQKEHRKQHKKECKKRAAELRDEILFKQPESTHLGDCPICCFPLPLDPSKSNLMSCCSKVICNGCDLANVKREYEGRLEQKCAFCRTEFPDTEEEINKQFMTRIEVNDPVAISFMGMKRKLEGDYETAFEYLTRAAALGDVNAHYQLSLMYHNGEGVEKNDKKFLHHTEKAAIEGCPFSRYNLGLTEWKNGRIDRAVKHYIIAANLGFDHSLDAVKDLFKVGIVSKEDFESALRGYQAAVDATKSAQREEAYAELTEPAASM